MSLKQIVTGQKMKLNKLQLAKAMRSEMTPAERKLWQHLRRNQLDGFHFRRQQVIEPYIVDFYCHQVAIVVEVDGGIHQEQEAYDRQRKKDLQERGVCVVRFTNLEVEHNLDSVLNEILHQCRERVQ
jgi:very-short-patch-repair endonuclease